MLENVTVKTSIAPEIVSDLKQRKFQSNRQFWQEFGGDLDKPDEYDNGVEKFANFTEDGNKKSLDRNSLIAGLIIESFNDSDIPIVHGLTEGRVSRFLKYCYYQIKRFTNFLWLHLFDFLVILLIAFLVIGSVLLFVHIANSFKSSQVVVKNQNGLSSFYKINENDLTVENRLSSENTLEDPKALNGRYILKSIKDGEPLTESHLIPNQFTPFMDGRKILSIPIRNEELNSRVKPVKMIGLLFKKLFISNDPSKDSLLVEDVLLLEQEKNKDVTNLTIAITANQLDLIKNITGNAEIFIVEK